jgi:hypothetical protein
MGVGILMIIGYEIINKLSPQNTADITDFERPFAKCRLVLMGARWDDTPPTH